MAELFGSVSIMRGSNRCSGSLTVEAALLFPMIIVIIMALVYFMLSLYDRTMIDSVLNEAVIKENMVVKQPSNYITGAIAYERLTERSLLYSVTNSHQKEEEQVVQYVTDALQGKLILSEVGNVEARTTSSSCLVRVEANVIFTPLPFFQFFTEQESIVQEVKIPLHNPSNFARTWDTILGIAEDTKYYDKVVKVLNAIFQVKK